jgi:hypothetical protein
MSVGGVSGASPFDPYRAPDTDEPAPPAASEPASIPALRSTTADGRVIDLLPKDTIWRVATGEPLPGAGGAPSLAFQPASGPTAEANRRATFGPVYDALRGGGGLEPGFREFVTAEAALSAVPAAILAPALKPAVDKGYSVIDKVPEALRRPLEKGYGLLIDAALSASGMAVQPLVDSTVHKFYPDGRNLPSSVDIPIQGYSQTLNSCGETAAATLLKAAGVPVSLGDVDTQTPFADGTNLLEDQEMRRRGLTAINGTGDLNKLKAFLAAGYPVMVSVGWEGGGGHYAVVTGYDEATKSFTIKSYDGEGGTNKVPYAEFAADWKRHKNYMTAVVPQRDKRLEPLIKSGDLRRPDQIYSGLTLSDFWVTGDGKVFVEGAYRYVGKSTDVTVRVNYNSSEEGLARQLGGSLAIRERVANGWWLGLKVEKMSLKGKADDWSSYRTAPIAAYGSLEGPGFELKAGGERGAFQASVAADLGKWISGLGVAANASVDAGGNYRVTGGVTWNF